MADYYTELSVEIFQKDVDFPLDDLYAVLTAMDENDFNRLPEVYKKPSPKTSTMTTTLRECWESRSSIILTPCGYTATEVRISN